MVRLPILTSLASALALCGLASAGSCGVTHCAAPVVVKQQVVAVKKVVAEVVPVAVYAPLAVAVPVYGGAYVAPQPVAPVQPATPPPAGELAQILTAINGVRGQIDSVNAKVDSLDARLRAVEGRATPPQPPPGPAVKPPDNRPDPFAPTKAGALNAHPGAAVFQGRCLTCHDAGAANEKGGKVVLSGKLDAQQRLGVLRSARTGAMPKGGKPLSDEEYANLADYIEAMP